MRRVFLLSLLLPSPLVAQDPPIRIVPHKHGLRQIALSQDGARILSVGLSDSREVKVWNLKDQACIRSFMFHSSPTLAEFTIDERAIHVVTRQGTSWQYQVCDVKSGAVTSGVSGTSEPPFAIWPKQDALVSLTEKGLKLLNVKTMEAKLIKNVRSGRVLCFSEDKNFAVTHAGIGKVEVIDMALDKRHAAIQIGNEDCSSCLITQDNKTLISLHHDAKKIFMEAYFWDIATTKQLRKLSFTFLAKSLGCITPEGRWLTILTERSVHYYDLKTHEFEGGQGIPFGGLVSVSYSRDGKRIATIQQFPGILRVFDLPKLDN